MKRIVIVCTAYFCFNLVLSISTYLIIFNKFSEFSTYLRKQEIRQQFFLNLERLLDDLEREIEGLNTYGPVLLANISSGEIDHNLKAFLSDILARSPDIKAINLYRTEGGTWTNLVRDEGIDLSKRRTGAPNVILGDGRAKLIFVNNLPLLSITYPLSQDAPKTDKIEVISSAWERLLNLNTHDQDIRMTMVFYKKWLEREGIKGNEPIFAPCDEDYVLLKKSYSASEAHPCQKSYPVDFTVPILKNNTGTILVGLRATSGNNLGEERIFRSILLRSAVGSILSSFFAFLGLFIALGLIFSRYERKALMQRSTIDVLEDAVKRKKSSLTKTTALLKREINEKRLIKAALSRHEDILESIFNGIQDGLLALDTEFNIMSANESIFRLFKVKPPIIGKKCYEYFHKKKEPCTPCPTKLAIEQKNLQRVELEISEKDGNMRWITVYAYPIFDKEKNVTGVVEFIGDVTEQKRLEREKESLKKQLIQSQKLEAIGTLAGGIAHDFNNILMAISGYIELAEIKGGPLTGDMKRYFHLINQSVEKASGLIKQLLIFSREEPMSVSEINLPQLISELMGMIGHLLGKKIEIELHFSDSSQIILGDKRRLEQVFMNLAINARDAMPQGGKISISTTTVDITEKQYPGLQHARPGEYVRIDFVDTGVGMDKDVVERIFEPFFTTKGIGKGTGLGLAIVYSIIKDHHGWIDVESEVGIGTKFSIFMPLHS